jgi:hypothetical protein
MLFLSFSFFRAFLLFFVISLFLCVAMLARELAASSSLPITPRIFPGRLHSSNRGAIDWGVQNLLAYGSHSYVTILQPPSLKVVQSLDQHKSLVTCVKWAPHALAHALPKASSPDLPQLQLASGDTSGNVFVWDVLNTSISLSLSDEAIRSSVIGIEWFAASNQLGVLYAPSQFAMWNLLTGSLVCRLLLLQTTRFSHCDCGQLYRLSFTEEMVGFCIDPFSPTQCYFMSAAGWISVATCMPCTTCCLHPPLAVVLILETAH